MSVSECVPSVSRHTTGNEWVWCVCASRPIGTHDTTHSARVCVNETKYSVRPNLGTHSTRLAFPEANVTRPPHESSLSPQARGKIPRERTLIR